MTPMRRLAAPQVVVERIAEFVRSAARDGSIVHPADLVKTLVTEFPDAPISPAEMAEAIVRQAAATGVAVQIGRAPDGASSTG